MGQETTCMKVRTRTEGRTNRQITLKKVSVLVSLFLGGGGESTASQTTVTGIEHLQEMHIS